MRIAKLSWNGKKKLLSFRIKGMRRSRGWRCPSFQLSASLSQPERASADVPARCWKSIPTSPFPCCYLLQSHRTTPATYWAAGENTAWLQNALRRISREGPPHSLRTCPHNSSPPPGDKHTHGVAPTVCLSDIVYDLVIEQKSPVRPLNHSLLSTYYVLLCAETYVTNVSWFAQDFSILALKLWHPAIPYIPGKLRWLVPWPIVTSETNESFVFAPGSMWSKSESEK